MVINVWCVYYQHNKYFFGFLSIYPDWREWQELQELEWKHFWVNITIYFCYFKFFILAFENSIFLILVVLLSPVSFCSVIQSAVCGFFHFYFLLYHFYYKAFILIPRITTYSFIHSYIYPPLNEMKIYCRNSFPFKVKKYRWIRIDIIFLEE